MPRIVRLVTAFSAVVAITATAACNRTDTNTTTDSTTVAATGGTGTTSGDERFGATMDGLSERPTTVNTGATGTADFTITSSGITYTINVTGLSSNPTGAHIHGPADANGTAGPIVPFDDLAQTMTGTLASGTIDASRVQGISFDSLKTLMRNGMAYVNVHTANHTEGEIRGQIQRR